MADGRVHKVLEEWLRGSADPAVARDYLTKAAPMAALTDMQTDGHRCNVGFGFWQFAHCSKLPLNIENFDAAYDAMRLFNADDGAHKPACISF